MPNIKKLKKISNELNTRRREKKILFTNVV